MAIEIVEQKTSLLDDAMAIIKEAADRGDYFSSEHMDVFINAMMHVLPEGERPWFNEIAEMNGVPKWQVLWSYFRRAQEYGVAPALLLDPNWEQMGVRRETITVCQECGTTFKPDHVGQLFCCNKCGGRAELKAKRAAEVVADGDSLSAGV